MKLRNGNARLRVGGARLANGSGSATTTPVSVYASTFSVAISQFSGIVGTNIIITVAPVGGAWPTNKAVFGTYSGSGGSFTSTSVVAGSSAAVSLTGSIGTASSGIINASIDGLTSTGGQTYTATAQSVTPITPTTPTKIGNRLDVIFDQSSVSPGANATGKAWNNGLWPAAGGTITIAAAGQSVTVAAPTSGSAPVSFSLPTGAAGSYACVVTNTLGVNNPAPPPLTVFTPSSGTARTLSASLVQFDQSVHQQDAVAGTPRGFTQANWGHGWGEVQFNITALSGATDGVWARPFSAFSPGASGAIGTGAALDVAVQVYGPISGPGLVKLQLPAGPRFTYWELATDAAFTNPTRVQQRTGVGHVVGLLGRSIMRTLVDSYAYGANQVPLGTDYPDTSIWAAFDPNNGGYADTDPTHYSTSTVQWFRNDGTTAKPWVGNFGGGSSAGAQERGRLLATYRGVITGFIGLVANGAAMDILVAHDGTPNSAFSNTISICGNKFRELQFEGSTNDGEWADKTYPYTVAEAVTRNQGFINWITQHVPACGVLTLHTGNSGYFNSIGSELAGFTRVADALNRQIAPVDPRVSVRHDTVWNARYGGHPTQNSRIIMAQSMLTQYLLAESAGWGGQQVPYDQRGPTLARTGTYVASTGTIRLPFRLNGAGSIKPVRIDLSNAPAVSYSNASPAEGASVISVFANDGYTFNGRPILIDSATVNMTSPPDGYDGTIDVVLTGHGTGLVTYDDNSTTAVPSKFNCHFGADFGASNQSVLCSFDQRTHGDPVPAITWTTDQTDAANGVFLGLEMQPIVDVVVNT